jgi:alpha-N-arabinofuranosidase
VLTPTYHVFEMYTVHQNATLLPSEVDSGDYKFGSEKMAAVSASASRDKAGKIHVTLSNAHPTAPAQVTCELEGVKAKALSGRVLTATEMDARNTFDKPNQLKPSEFTAFKTTDKGFTTTLPPKSVVVLEVD